MSGLTWPRALSLLMLAVSLAIGYIWSAERVQLHLYPSRATLANSYGIPGTRVLTFVDDYIHDVQTLDYNRTAQNGTTQNAQVTAVVLNWSRFSNVLLIASLLCGSELNGVVAEVVIWNNSPKNISYDDFAATGCPRTKLRLHNSEANLYFHARFIACAQAKTDFCFIQDDDYLVRPEIVESMFARLASSSSSHPGAIHILPAHEHLSSTLRTLAAGRTLENDTYRVHTSFAWLGHGAMVRRALVGDFLDLMAVLNATHEEMKMADNYFTVLANRVPELWLDQGIELGGGQPFTVGSEGDQRNIKHINQALHYLDTIVGCDDPPCAGDGRHLPYMDISLSPIPPIDIIRAVCAQATCVVETNIDILSSHVHHDARAAEDMLLLEGQRMQHLGGDKEHYEAHPLSAAVDGKGETFFSSPRGARAGEYITLDTIYGVGVSGRSQAVIQFVLLLDRNTEAILNACSFATSLDGTVWVRCPVRVILQASYSEQRCQRRVESRMACADANLVGEALRECSVDVGRPRQADVRYLRVKLEGEDRRELWRINEVFVRGSA